MAPGWQLQDICIGAFRLRAQVHFGISGSFDLDLGMPGLVRHICGLSCFLFVWTQVPRVEFRVAWERG